MAKTQAQAIAAASKALEDHMKAGAAQIEKEPDPQSREVLKFTIHQRGALALIQLPYRSDTPEFAIACRSFRQPAEECGVTCLFFDSRQIYESFNGDNDLALARLGLMRIGKR